MPTEGIAERIIVNRLKSDDGGPVDWSIAEKVIEEFYDSAVINIAIHLKNQGINKVSEKIFSELTDFASDMVDHFDEKQMKKLIKLVEGK